MVRPVHKHRLQQESTLRSDFVTKHRRNGEEDGVVKCRACLRELSGQMYWCRLCSFYFHEECANLKLRIETFFHPCPLSLHVSSGYTCDFCFEHRSSVFRYRCSGCDFDMDVECAHQALSYVSACEGEREKKQVLHCCHRHPLQPLLFETQTNSPCGICDIPCSSPPIWGCQPCNFHLHKSCLDFLPQRIDTNLHSDTASWVLQSTLRPKRCIDCEQTTNSKLVFRRYKKFQHLCITCCLVRRMAEESCSPVIDHFSHPCRLTLTFSPFSTCSACFQNHHNYFYYHCKPCDFFLNFDCFQETNQIQHFCHCHPLNYFMKDGKICCDICEGSCFEPFYGCTRCQFYIHKPCMNNLPRQTIHPLLNQTIVLLPVVFFDCITCNRTCSRLTFRCIESGQKFCVRCILWPQNKFDDSERFISIHHWHPLTSGNIDKESTACCFMCGEQCFGSTYNCKECNILFHKSCAELPRQLQEHHIHPDHPLTLIYDSASNSTEQVNCNLCFKTLPTCYKGFYRCEECNFYLDTRCASLLPSVAYQGHPHLLCLLENLHDQRSCHLCGSSCKGFPSFRCAKCDFSLHLLCGPLPCTIKHASHIHPLVVQDYYVEDNESDMFACHICEEHRDPRLRIYRCVESCLMICEVKCVLPEVVASLRGELGAIKLETPYPRIACKVITRDLVFKEVSDANERGEDEKINKYVFSTDKIIELIEGQSPFEREETFGIEALEEEDVQKHQHNEERTKNQIEFASEGEDETGSLTTEVLSLDGDEPIYSYSREAFERFTKLLEQYTSSWYDEDIFLQYDGSSMVGAYSLPEVLKPVYEELIEKYDAFGPTWDMLGYPVKRFLVFTICSIIHNMRTIKVVDVQKEKIQDWLHILKSLQNFRGTAVKLNFLIEHVMRVGRAHFMVQARHIVDTKSSKLHKEEEELSTRRRELLRELKEIEMKLEENEKEKEEHNIYKATGSCELKREYSDTLEIKWKPCFEFFSDKSKRA